MRRLAACIAAVAVPACLAQTPGIAEKSNMELVGFHDLQGRSAYQPIVH